MGQLSKLHFAAGESYPNKFSDRHVSYVIYLKVKIRHCICYREKLIFRSTPNKAWYLTTKFTATWNNRTNSLRRSLSAGRSHSRPFRSPEPQRPSVSAGNQVSVTQFLVWNAIRLHPLTRWRGGRGGAQGERGDGVGKKGLTLSFFGSRFISRSVKTENPLPRCFFAPKPNGNACYPSYT